MDQHTKATPDQNSEATVYSIGHSNLPFEKFVAVLRDAHVDAVADVRSAPRSTNYPQYDRDQFREGLRDWNISYVFLGDQLGGRPKSPKLYRDGIADYDKMAITNEFEEGLSRVIAGARRFRLALMCSEHDPLDCHRCLLISRALKAHGIDVQHIFHDGHIESQTQLEERLLKSSKKENDDLFAPRDERVAMAYHERARKVAFRLDSASQKATR